MVAARRAHVADTKQADQGQRLDKWLYFSRLAKSRAIAAELILGGKVRVNRVRAGKPSQLLRPGEVVTIALKGRILVLKVLAAGRRRGPPTEARTLYDIVSAPAGTPQTSTAPDTPSKTGDSEGSR
jgi:ribosome-associated heat shock protein Hsp15